MKWRILIILIILTSLFGYLEWGQNNSSFLFEAEGVLLRKLLTNPSVIIHPFTIIPFLGQLLLFISLFQNRPGKIIVYAGIFSVGILMLLIFIIGLLSLKYKIVLSAVPFLIVTSLTIIYFRKHSSIILIDKK